MKILMKEGMLLGILLTMLALPAMAEGQCLGDCYYCTKWDDGTWHCYKGAKNVTCSYCQVGEWESYRSYWHPTTPGCPDMNYTECPECCDGKDNDDDGRIDCNDPECACCCDQTEDTDDTAECVPEPITLAMTTLGILGVLGFISLKRERR